MASVLILIVVTAVLVAYAAALIRLFIAFLDYGVEGVGGRRKAARHLLVALIDTPLAPLSMPVRLMAFARQLRIEAGVDPVIDEAERLVRRQ